MTMPRRLVCLLFLAAAPALGQGPLEPSRLPANTTFYLHWRGTSALQAVRGTNSLLRLWADPEFAPARKALTDAFYAGARKKAESESGSWTQQEVEQILSVLENPLVIGFTGGSDDQGTPVGSQGAGGQGERAAQSARLFVILDTTGKERIIRNLQERTARAAKAPLVITSYAFGPTTVEKVVAPAETYYRATIDHYLVRAGQQTLIEDLISRLRSPEPPTSSLKQAADFRSAERQVDRGALLDFFGRVPDLSKMAFPAKAGFDTQAFVGALHLEHLRAITGSLSFSGEGTRMRAALLGDTSPGSILDLLGENSPSFSTLPLALAGTASYSVGQINLALLYPTVRGALLEALTPKQRTNIELFEAVIANQIDMKIPDALELLRGELASIMTAGDFDPLAQLYAATIQKPPQVLHLLRTIFATQISAEDHEGDTTYLNLSFLLPGSTAGSPRRHFYYVAVTSRMLLAAPRKRLLREAVARLAVSDKAGDAAPLAADPAFRRARGQFPQSLTSLGYLDLTRVSWEKLIETSLKASQQNGKQASSSTADEAQQIKSISPDVVRRYLHTLIDATWKDRDGIYFDGHLE